MTDALTQSQGQDKKMDGSSSSSSSTSNGKNAAIITPIISAAGLLVALAVAFWTNSKGDVNTVKSELREDIRLAEERETRAMAVLREIIQQKIVYLDAYKTYQDRVDRTMDIFKDDIRVIRNDQVSRSEHIQHWTDTADRLADIRNSLTEERKQRSQDVADIRKDFGGTYTLGDVVKQLQSQIQTLNQRLDSLKAAPAPATGPSATKLNAMPTTAPQSIVEANR